jgi:capping protein (actin filament) muscle Z-line, alpha
VQLAASHPQDIELDLSNVASSSQSPSADEAEKIAQVIAVAIKKYEQEYHAKLNERYTELSEKAFKAMRRQLPVTKQKLDWDKVRCASSELAESAR